jgi:hypothetical protein
MTRIGACEKDTQAHVINKMQRKSFFIGHMEKLLMKIMLLRQQGMPEEKNFS